MWNFIKNLLKKTKEQQPTFFEQPKPKTMRDAISIPRVEKLHPKVRDEVKQIIINAEAKFPKNIAIRIVQALRTWEEQDKLYAQGRNGNPGPKVTNAKGGQSYHNFGLAIDFALLYDKDGNGSYEELSWDVVKDMDKDKVPDWNEVVALFEAAGWEWGGKFRTFKDLPHCQKTFGLTVAKCRELYAQGKFISGTRYIII